MRWRLRYPILGVTISMLSMIVSSAEGSGLQTVAAGIYLWPGAQEDFSMHNRGHIANKGFIVGKEAVAVIDTGSSYLEGLALRERIKELTSLPIKYVILTHMHPDHVLGAAAFSRDKPLFIGHLYLEDALLRRASVYLRRMREILGDTAEASQIVYPTQTVIPGHAITLNLGDRQLLLSAYATGHTNNDITVYDGKTGTLWLSDLLFVDRIPVMDGSLLGWISIIDNFFERPCSESETAKAKINLVSSIGIQCVPVERVVPGHGPTVTDWRVSLQHERRYLVHLRDGLRDAIRRGWSISRAVETVGQEERGEWLLFDQYHGRNVTAGFVELEWE
jgi:quinoprotein relay system zinc metallohydrolase 2